MQFGVAVAGAGRALHALARLGVAGVGVTVIGPATRLATVNLGLSRKVLVVADGEHLLKLGGHCFRPRWPNRGETVRRFHARHSFRFRALDCPDMSTVLALLRPVKGGRTELCERCDLGDLLRPVAGGVE